jgi:hypothetical protein
MLRAGGKVGLDAACRARPAQEVHATAWADRHAARPMIRRGASDAEYVHKPRKATSLRGVRRRRQQSNGHEICGQAEVWFLFLSFFFLGTGQSTAS